VKCNFVPGDVVVWRASHENLCAEEEHGVFEDWGDYPDMEGKFYRIESMAAATEGPCVVLTLADDPTGTPWCWGTFRRLEKSTLSVAQMCAAHKPVHMPAATPTPEVVSCGCH
jgi:hypothetical protein